jgi:NEDD8-activating enzyme E1
MPSLQVSCIDVAACTNEAYKIATNCAPPMNNYMMYVGDQGIYTFTFNLEKKDNCTICGTSQQTIDVPQLANLQDLIDILLEKTETYVMLI